VTFDFGLPLSLRRKTRRASAFSPADELTLWRIHVFRSEDSFQTLRWIAARGSPRVNTAIWVGAPRSVSSGPIGR